MWTEPDEQIEELRQMIGELREQMRELEERIPPLYAGTIKPAPVVELDAGQAAALLGVSRQYFVNELSKKPGFPKPSTNLSQKTRRWRYADLLKVKARTLKGADHGRTDSPGRRP